MLSSQYIERLYQNARHQKHKTSTDIWNVYIINTIILSEICVK